MLVIRTIMTVIFGPLYLLVLPFYGRIEKALDDWEADSPIEEFVWDVVVMEGRKNIAIIGACTLMIYAMIGFCLYTGVWFM